MVVKQGFCRRDEIEEMLEVNYYGWARSSLKIGIT